MANKKYKWFLTKRNRAMKKNNPVVNDFYTHIKKEQESLKQKEERTKNEIK